MLTRHWASLVVWCLSLLFAVCLQATRAMTAPPVSAQASKEEGWVPLLTWRPGLEEGD